MAIFIKARQKALAQCSLNFPIEPEVSIHAYFYHYSKLEQEEAIKTAKTIWEEINKINLEENIIPTKERASLIMTKGSNHSITNVRLRK